MLATVGNSFFAGAFGIEKKSVVKARMSGVSGEDLWIAYYAASLTGARPGSLMAVRRSAPSWASSITAGQGEPGGLEGRFGKAVRDDLPDGELAALAAGEVLAHRLGTSREELTTMWSTGARLSEIVAAAVISRWDGRPPSALLSAVREKRTTWGSLLYRQGIAPEEAGSRIGALLGRSPIDPGRKP